MIIERIILWCIIIIITLFFYVGYFLETFPGNTGFVIACFIVGLMLCSIILYNLKECSHSASWEKFWDKLFIISILFITFFMLLPFIIMLIRGFYEIEIKDLLSIGEDLLRILIASVGVFLLFFSLGSLIVGINNLYIFISDLISSKSLKRLDIKIKHIILWIILWIISTICGFIIMWLIMFKI